MIGKPWYCQHCAKFGHKYESREKVPQGKMVWRLKLPQPSMDTITKGQETIKKKGSECSITSKQGVQSQIWHTVIKDHNGKTYKRNVEYTQERGQPMVDYG